MTENSADINEFTPLLSTYNWGAEWQRLQEYRRAADDASYWDGRAKHFGAPQGVSPYAKEFIQLAAIKPGESVLDMGCGTGSLAIPLAQLGHPVIAADFSSGMLAELQYRQDLVGVEGITCKQLAWNDSWDEVWVPAGLDTGSVDVAIASRSIATSDLADSLKRLTEVARRRACITLPVTGSPGIDARALQEIGMTLVLAREYQYAFNILLSMGYFPEISYIRSERADTFKDFEAAWEKYRAMIEKSLPTNQLDQASHYELLLSEWLEAELIPNPEAGKPDSHGQPQGALTMRRPRTTIWAFMSWNK